MEHTMQKVPTTVAGVELRNAVIDALMSHPSRVVDAPAWPGGRSTAADVLYDGVAGSDELIAEMVTIVSLASKAADPALRMRAGALIANVAAKFAWLQEDFLEDDSRDLDEVLARMRVPLHQRAL